MNVMSQGLEKNGFKVRGFTDPHAAISYFNDQKAPCDLVVSDARMPGMSGFELSRRIKSMRSGVRIVLVSAFEIHKDEYEKVMPKTPIDGFLKKPFHMSQLMEVLQAFD